MLRKEGEVYTNKYKEEVDFCSSGVKGQAGKQGESVSEGSE